MKFLYIDKANSIKDIRIAERTIWSEEMSTLGHDVHFFLLSTKKNKSNLFFENQDIIHSSKSLMITLILFLFKLPIIIKKVKPEFLVVRNVLDLGLIAYIYTKIYGIQIIYIKAFPYLEFKAYKTTGPLKYILRFMLKIEVWLMNNVDFLLIRTEEFKSQLSNKYDITRKSLVVPMGFNRSSINEISEIEKREIKLKYKLDKEYVGVYFGAIDRMRKIDFLLDILDKVFLARRNLNFLIIGGSEVEVEVLLKNCNERSMGISIIPSMDREQLFKIIQVCDFSVSPIPPIHEYVLSSPTKVIESLGLGCPVIVNNEILDQNEVVINSKGGISVNYSSESFSNEIVNVLDGNYDLREMALSGKKYVFDQRNYSQMAKHIVTYIQSGEN